MALVARCFVPIFQIRLSAAFLLSHPPLMIIGPISHVCALWYIYDASQAAHIIKVSQSLKRIKVICYMCLLFIWRGT
jgi:hypothetical protein